MEDDYQRYRQEQKEAVSNHSGSSASDVLFVILPNTGSILLALTIVTWFGHRLSELSRVFIEFATVVVPCILCCTIYADKVITISQTFFILAAANILLILAYKPKDSFKYFPNEPSSKLPFITSFRAMINIISIICILAVDFQCFPRKYAKTEVYGYSLMDTGVGFYVISNALVSPEARLVDSRPKPPFFQGIVKTVKGCIPLLVLGLARYVSIEIIGYQKHVTEYGVHWNFFMTLASVRLLTGLLSKSLSSKYSLLTGIWILGMHEYALSTHGLKEWILSDEPRDDLISANREGWVSIPGYVGLYLLGVALGRLVHSAYKDTENQLVFNLKLSTYDFKIGYTRSMSLTVKLYVIANVAFLITYYCEQYFHVSRRLANSAYCSWIFTISALFLTCLLMIDVIMECITGCAKEKSRRKIAKHLRRDDLNAKENVNVVKTLKIFEAVNENGLLFFLFANLLTGAVNMSIKTLHVDSTRAVAIIIAYMVTNMTFVLLRYRGKNILSAKKNN